MSLTIIDDPQPCVYPCTHTKRHQRNLQSLGLADVCVIQGCAWPYDWNVECEILCHKGAYVDCIISTLTMPTPSMSLNQPSRDANYPSIRIHRINFHLRRTSVFHEDYSTEPSDTLPHPTPKDRGSRRNPPLSRSAPVSPQPAPQQRDSLLPE